MSQIIGVVVMLAILAFGASFLTDGEDDDSAGQGAEIERPPGGAEAGDADVAVSTTEAVVDDSVAGDDSGGSSVGAGDSGESATEPPPLGDPTAPPTGGWIPFHDELAQSCHDGNMFDCDYLYDGISGIALPDSQPHKDYAGTCGGRIGEPANGECEAWYGTTL